MGRVHFQPAAYKGIHLIRDSNHNSQDKDHLPTYKTMVDPSDMLTQMFPFDHHKQAIVMPRIWMLGSHLFQGKKFQSLVFLASDTKSAIHRHDESSNFLSLVLPPN